MTDKTMQEVTPETLKGWLDNEKAVLIDIREPDEFSREHIPGARLVPLSGFNPDDFPHDHEKAGVFYCHMGDRTARNAARILATGFTQVYQLKGGVQAWKRSGLPLNVNKKAPLAIMRQVQIVAGSLALLGAVLAYLVSPWFIILCGFVGAGLIFAGVTGECPMALILQRMPWNQNVGAADTAHRATA